MRNFQNMSLRLSDGNHNRWISTKEATRLVEQESAFWVKNASGTKNIAVQLCEVPDPSLSKATQAELTRRDMDFLADLDISKIEGGMVSHVSPGMICEIQRLMGHGAIPFNENFASV